MRVVRILASRVRASRRRVRAEHPRLGSIIVSEAMVRTLVANELLAVAALACYLPALRATRLDPTVALRSD